ncbi:type II toxin-antitoxin system CcdA family antitoxin [Candidatus Dojkabacteria bacterium]|jgi:uncharacterized protein with PIN domain|nr:type II toxin-antitoxin system CcdA family antitoxin [Candidatus Dojkabacteria bacterium]
MSKKAIAVSVDEYIHQQAKERGINISEVLDRALIHKLNPENEIDKTGDKCEYCGREMRQATANDMNGLYWFLPDEKWICPTCEHRFISDLMKNKVLQ